jgi:hypothetical protein
MFAGSSACDAASRCCYSQVGPDVVSISRWSLEPCKPRLGLDSGVWASISDLPGSPEAKQAAPGEKALNGETSHPCGQPGRARASRQKRLHRARGQSCGHVTWPRRVRVADAPASRHSNLDFKFARDEQCHDSAMTGPSWTLLWCGGKKCNFLTPCLHGVLWAWAVRDKRLVFCLFDPQHGIDCRIDGPSRVPSSVRRPGVTVAHWHSLL